MAEVGSHAAQGTVRIAPLDAAQVPLWSSLRAQLWPDTAAAEHAREADALCTRGDYLVLLAFDSDAPAGFAEAALRHDYVNGCDSSPLQPVAFLEGIYVRPAHRGRGIARALVAHVADWARAQGAFELASDASIDNTDSHAMHRALGFEETERVVFFRRTLR